MRTPDGERVALAADPVASQMDMLMAERATSQDRAMGAQERERDDEFAAMPELTASLLVGVDAFGLELDAESLAAGDATLASGAFGGQARAGVAPVTFAPNASATEGSYHTQGRAAQPLDAWSAMPPDPSSLLGQQHRSCTGNAGVAAAQAAARCAERSALAVQSISSAHLAATSPAGAATMLGGVADANAAHALPWSPGARRSGVPSAPPDEDVPDTFPGPPPTDAFGIELAEDAEDAPWGGNLTGGPPCDTSLAFAAGIADSLAGDSAAETDSRGSHPLGLGGMHDLGLGRVQGYEGGAHHSPSAATFGSCGGPRAALEAVRSAGSCSPYMRNMLLTSGETAFGDPADELSRVDSLLAGLVCDSNPRGTAYSLADDDMAFGLESDAASDDPLRDSVGAPIPRAVRDAGTALGLSDCYAEVDRFGFTVEGDGSSSGNSPPSPSDGERDLMVNSIAAAVSGRYSAHVGEVETTISVADAAAAAGNRSSGAASTAWEEGGMEAAVAGGTGVGGVDLESETMGWMGERLQTLRKHLHSEERRQAEHLQHAHEHAVSLAGRPGDADLYVETAASPFDSPEEGEDREPAGMLRYDHPRATDAMAPPAPLALGAFGSSELGGGFGVNRLAAVGDALQCAPANEVRTSTDASLSAMLDDGRVRGVWLESTQTTEVPVDPGVPPLPLSHFEVSTAIDDLTASAAAALAASGSLSAFTQATLPKPSTPEAVETDPAAIAAALAADSKALADAIADSSAQFAADFPVAGSDGGEVVTLC